MRIGSLFSGAGGLDIAVQAVFGGEVVWHAEIDKAASKVLAHHWPDVPNLGDVSDINWDSVPPVDILCGGFPCQDVSAAGRRAGINDGTRSGLWAVFAEAIDWLHPRIVVIENVRGLLSALAHRNGETDDERSDVESGAAVVGDGASRPVLRAAGAVLGDLADLGYDAQWATVAAADVGAPHRRERVLIVAADTESARWSVWDTTDERSSHREVNALADDRGSAPDSACVGRHEGRPEPARLERGFDAAVSGDGHGVDTPLLPTPVVTDALGARNSTAWRSNPDHNISIGDTLTDVMWKMAAERGEMELPTGPTQKQLLPTPTSRDHKGRNQRDDDTCLPGALIPTPNAQDGNGGKAPRGGRATHDTGTKRQVPLTDLPDLLPTEQTTHWGKYEPAIRRWEQLTRPAPAPTEPNKNGNPRLSAAFSEWLMGWPAGWVTHPDIGISRNDQLRIVGNGVCPQQAAAALRYLLGVA